MQFGIDVGRSYSRMLGSCKRFLKCVGVKYDFKPTKDLSKAQNLGELIDYFEHKLNDMNLSLCVTKKRPQGEEMKILDSVVYRFGAELESTIVIIYASPAKYLSPSTAAVYKRFLKFYSDCTNIPLGMIGNDNNFYLDCVLNCYDDEIMEEMYENRSEEEDYSKHAEAHKHIISSYKKDGEFWNLFNEIEHLPQEKAETLYQYMDEYRKDCPNNELELVEAMMDGIDIVKDMNVFWFEFNPEDDGLPDAYGNTDGDGWASSVFSSAILYSEHDGVGEEMLDMINSNVNAGICMSGWNIHQWLSPTISKEYIDEFMRCKDLVAEFNKWLSKFCTEIEKFDKYE